MNIIHNFFLTANMNMNIICKEYSQIYRIFKYSLHSSLKTPHNNSVSFSYIALLCFTFLPLTEINKEKKPCLK